MQTHGCVAEMLWNRRSSRWSRLTTSRATSRLVRPVKSIPANTLLSSANSEVII
jgi:hypothetical protein